MKTIWKQNTLTFFHFNFDFRFGIVLIIQICFDLVFDWVMIWVFDSGLVWISIMICFGWVSIFDYGLVWFSDTVLIGISVLFRLGFWFRFSFGFLLCFGLGFWFGSVSVFGYAICLVFRLGIILVLDTDLFGFSFLFWMLNLMLFSGVPLNSIWMFDLILFGCLIRFCFGCCLGWYIQFCWILRFDFLFGCSFRFGCSIWIRFGYLIRLLLGRLIRICFGLRFSYLVTRSRFALEFSDGLVRWIFTSIAMFVARFLNVPLQNTLRNNFPLLQFRSLLPFDEYLLKRQLTCDKYGKANIEKKSTTKKWVRCIDYEIKNAVASKQNQNTYGNQHT